jgi:ABC-type branched-subunit amino acid transport system substrate-binding protein
MIHAVRTRQLCHGLDTEAGIASDPLMVRKLLGIGALALAVAAAPGCGKDKNKGEGGDKGAGKSTDDGTGAARPGGLKTDKGVDAANKVVKIALLNDESGPAAVIGKPYAKGKRLLAKRVNAGGSGLLPDGWTIELVEKDHQYNPQQSVQHYNAVKGDVLFIGHSFGTPNTLPLRDMLERDNIIAFPASLSSEMANHAHTPPLGPSYKVEAMRAMDWIVDTAGGADKVKASIVYQKDDYGKDGVEGWKAAAAHHGVKIVSEQTVAPGQKDVTAVVTALKEAKATHVLLTVLPSATGPIVGTAAQLQYGPTWVGNTPAWIDGFFNPEVIPSAVFGNYYSVTGFPYWGEDVPGMAEFAALWKQHEAELGPQDWYILASYVQGLAELEALSRAIAAGDATRAGYKTALQGIDNWNAGGLTQPVSLSAFPYVTSTRTRVLKPDFENKSWTEVAPYAEPATPL